jgi:hypothetical protein
MFLTISISKISQGLRRDDMILQFGHVSSPPITQLASVVADSENMPLRVVVLRPSNGAAGEGGAVASQRLELEIVPKKWSGKGLTGAHIVPV